MMGGNKMKQDRLTQIKHLLMQNKRVNNNDLTEMFSVSLATIRRDLDRLEEEGIVRRVYGGAVFQGRPPAGSPSERHAEGAAGSRRDYPHRQRGQHVDL